MNSTHLSADAAAQIIESAFAPLRCVAEAWDYKAKVKFRVYDSSDAEVITVPEVLPATFSKEKNLESEIQSWRREVIRRGQSLDPWSFP